MNRANFLNNVAKMLRVYQESAGRTEEFEYDKGGNRKTHQVTLIQPTLPVSSLYYNKTNRLKTDGKYAFKYDDAGNLKEKGNKFTLNGDDVSFETGKEGVEYWQYQYDLLNRLIKVTKNGTMISEYAYDPDGLRVIKRAKGETTHYVFEGTEPIFEKKISTGKIKSYVYAFGKYLARVDGVIGDSTAKVYYYHTDYEGTIRAITDQAGEVVFNADYFAFGTKFTDNSDFDELHGFTGKEYDPDIGLYYFNARWYDPELGRFISEDPAADPNNPNLYSYGANNPVMYNDPTGQDLLAAVIGGIFGGVISASRGGSFLTGFYVGFVCGLISWGASEGLGALFSGAESAAVGSAASNAYAASGSWTAYGEAFANTMAAWDTGIAFAAGALAGGVINAAYGGSFWEGVGEGLFSGFITMGLNAGEGAPSGDAFTRGIRNWFNNTFYKLVRNGKMDLAELILSGVEAAVSAAVETPEEPVTGDDSLPKLSELPGAVDENGNPVNVTSNATVVKYTSKEGKVTKNSPPPEEAGYKAPKSGPKMGKTPDGKTGWVDKNGNVWVPVPDGSPLAHGGGHWDVLYPGGGYDNVYPNGNVRAGKGSRGQFSPPGVRIDTDEITKESAVITGIIYGLKIIIEGLKNIVQQLGPVLI